MKEIECRLVYDFTFDAEGFDEEFIDIHGLARDSLLRELKYDLEHGGITDGDVKIIKEVE